MEEPVLLSVVTSPAPNTGAVQKNSPHELTELHDAFYRRAEHILAVAAAKGHDSIVLGAWGCGAFQGDPKLAADAFGRALDGRFAGRFDRVVFAILANSRPGRANLQVFRERFGA